MVYRFSERYCTRMRETAKLEARDVDSSSGRDGNWIRYTVRQETRSSARKDRENVAYVGVQGAQLPVNVYVLCASVSTRRYSYRYISNPVDFRPFRQT